MKESSKRIGKYLKDISMRYSLWFLSILYLEGMFVLLISHTISIQLCINVLITTGIASAIFSIVTGIWKEKGNAILTLIFLFLLGVIFSLQAVFYKIFDVYFSIYNMALQDQLLNGFLKSSIILILKNGLYILALMVPFILSCIFYKKIKKLSRINWKRVIGLILSICLWLGIYLVYIHTTSNQNYSTYELYHNVNNISLSIKRLGVINNYQLELRRVLFGFTPQKIESVSFKQEEEVEEEIVYEPNQLSLNLNDTGNTAIDSIHAYMREEEPTLKNEYTGMFKGYNLIYITAESFSEIGVDEILTPTLYRLTHSGFIFKNF